MNFKPIKYIDATFFAESLNQYCIHAAYYVCHGLIRYLALCTNERYKIAR